MSFLKLVETSCERVLSELDAEHVRFGLILSSELLLTFGIGRGDRC